MYKLFWDSIILDLKPNHASNLKISTQHRPIANIIRTKQAKQERRDLMHLVC